VSIVTTAVCHRRTHPASQTLRRAHTGGEHRPGGANDGATISGQIFVDKGYRGHDYQGPAKVLLAKPKRKQEPELRRWYGKRNGIEAAISHMKNDGWLGRNYLKGTMGNRVNALLAACGQILRKLLRWLAKHPAATFCPCLWFLLLRLHTADNPSAPA
jgi:transposase, IS5 family